MVREGEFWLNDGLREKIREGDGSGGKVREGWIARDGSGREDSGGRLWQGGFRKAVFTTETFGKQDSGGFGNEGPKGGLYEGLIGRGRSGESDQEEEMEREGSGERDWE